MKTGTTPNIDISVRTPGHDDNFAFVWEGFINIPTAGTYTFETLSDDGSKLYFNSNYSPTATALVNNDGIHGPWTPATGTINIPAAGTYPIAFTFFEATSGELMQAYWSGPSITRQLIPNSAFSGGTPPSFAGFEDIFNSSAMRNGGSGLLNETKENTDIRRAYPNPFKESFNIDFYNSAANNNITVGVYDMKGRLVYTDHIGSLAAGNNTVKVNLRDRALQWGVYMVSLNINGKLSKMVKMVRAPR